MHLDVEIMYLSSFQISSTMDLSDMLTLKPIGFMKSVFHFKNGTPRQSSLCENARGILTIDKSVFNNPEHSLDGLQDFSHAWILFMFHKNNNVHKKAKVKPPRLNGQRVGVFSTRSPYRPNNIGLSLAKIDKIQGASVHFSGIDILDGTPIIDIKPYIPEYDKPFTTQSILSRESISKVNELHVNSTEEMDHNLHPPFMEEKDRFCPDDDSVNAPRLLEKQNSLSVNDNDTKELSTGKDISKDSTKSSPVQYDSIEDGFYSLSAALDRAGAALQQGSQVNDSKHKEQQSSDMSEVLLSNVIGSIEQLKSTGKETEVDEEDDVLNSLVGDVICRAASDVIFAAGEIMRGTGTNTVFNSSETGTVSNDSNSNSHDKPLSGKGDVTDKHVNAKDNSAVIAPWLSSPPVSKVCVKFSLEALQQLKAFHNEATDPRFRTDMLSGPEDAETAITSILHQEPRSVYRRQRCQNSEYFFAVDVLHVTCWFDGDVVTVLRIKPAADVPQLQEKGSSSGDKVKNVKKKNT